MPKKTITLEEFARDAGIKLITCDPKEWGGSIGYMSADFPNMSTCGFKTEKSALRHWVKDTFGEKAGKALIRLLA